MLEVENVSYQYEQTPVLNQINLSVEDGEIVCLLGESGSGKTTLLRVIAGLEMGYSGKVIVNEQVMQSIPIHQRGFGLMFQDFALFPHMTVAQNVVYGLKMKGVSKKEQSQIVDEMLSLVGLDRYQDRRVDALSGGQKQRVALARSLAPRPKLLMLDEPLGSLDAGLREHLVLELRQIIKQIGLTAIYVTHDQQEAYAIADRIAVMNKGQIEQYDTPEALYRHPKTVFVARFLGLSNIVSSEFLNRYIDLSSDAKTYLIHPQNISLSRDGQIQAIIRERTFQGENYRIKVMTDDHVELSLLVPSSSDIANIGDRTQLAINPDTIQAINS